MICAQNDERHHPARYMVTSTRLRGSLHGEDASRCGETRTHFIVVTHLVSQVLMSPYVVLAAVLSAIHAPVAAWRFVLLKSPEHAHGFPSSFVDFLFAVQSLFLFDQRHHRRKLPLFVFQSFFFQPWARPSRYLRGPFLLQSCFVVAAAQWSAAVPTA